VPSVIVKTLHWERKLLDACSGRGTPLRRFETRTVEDIPRTIT